MSSSRQKLEIFLYDTQRVKKETDDPRSAIIFHYPQNLPDRSILLHAGHLAALYLAARAFMDLQGKELFSGPHFSILKTFNFLA